MHCLRLFKLESNHLFLNTPCRVSGGMCGGACSLPFAEEAAGRCMPGSRYSWRKPICIISLSCDHAADHKELLPAAWEGRMFWGEYLLEKEGRKQQKIKYNCSLLVWSPRAEAYRRFGCSCQLVSGNGVVVAFKVRSLSCNKPFTEQEIEAGFAPPGVLLSISCCRRDDLPRFAKFSLVAVAIYTPRSYVYDMRSNSLLGLHVSIGCALYWCQGVSWVFAFFCALGSSSVGRRLSSCALSLGVASHQTFFPWLKGIVGRDFEKEDVTG